MGFFSWKTSDTNKSIANCHSRRKTFKVFMITEDRQIFEEDFYGGYGEFGGEDFYVLLGKLNGVSGETDEEIRDKVFNGAIVKRGITNGVKTYNYQEDFANYATPIKAEGGKCANDLVKEGYKDVSVVDTKLLVEMGFKVPKLVQKLPKKYHLMTDEEWKEYFNSLPVSERCENQGFFY
jgi:hypothetical protein